MSQLNEPLPFRAGSIDAFAGFLISSVAGHRALLNEIACCLKPGGRFAVAEIFFEKGSETYRQLVHENAVYAPFDDYVSCCKENGLIDKGGALVKKLAGKIDPDDLLPLNDTDTSEIRTASFEKAKVLHRSAAKIKHRENETYASSRSLRQPAPKPNISMTRSRRLTAGGFAFHKGTVLIRINPSSSSPH